MLYFIITNFFKNEKQFKKKNFYNIKYYKNFFIYKS